VDRTVIYEYVQDSLEVCREWFRDHIEWETVQVTFTSAISCSGYVPLTSLSKPVYMVDMLVPVFLRSAGDFVLEEISDLLGLPAGLFTSAATREYATWLQVRSMILKSMGKEMDWQVIGDRIYVDDIPHDQGQVTVIYVPLPQTLDEVTYGPAVNWIKRRVLAKTKIAQATVIGKFSAGGINFTTNAEVLRTEGKTDLDKLDEELKTLQFSYNSFKK
jgi:hypothetical protein